MTMTPARCVPPIPAHPGVRPERITHAELPLWVPGEILCASDNLDWKGVAQRTYRYLGQDVEIPPLDCYVVVHYEDGQTPMDRQFDGRWTRTRCAPGHFSLLSQAANSHWRWTEGIVVSHVYLSADMLCRVASDMQQRPVSQVRLHDVLSGSDPVIDHLVRQFKCEAAQAQLGSALYAEALSLQLAVHLLRHYAVCAYRTVPRCAPLSTPQLQRLQAYVDHHLAGPIALHDMATALGMGAWTLNRHLRATLGTSAYQYVLDQRVARARRLLQGSTLTLKDIAAASGFADQSHMTRTLRAHLGRTPGQLRAGAHAPAAPAACQGSGSSR